jgi:polyisoprenoid-binding protein YceI
MAVRKNLLFVCGLTSLLTCSNLQIANAQQAASARPRSRTMAKSYEAGDVDLERSRVYIHVDKTGLGHEHAVVGRLQSGRVEFGGEQQAGELVFDMAHFAADTNDARNYLGLDGSSDPSTQRKVTENMLGSAVLDVAQFPTASYKITAVRDTGKRTQRQAPIFEFAGVFTLHGVARPLKFLVEAEPQEHWTRLRGSFPIRQTDFGITPFSKAFGAIGVADQLKIYGDVLIAHEATSTVVR